MFCFRVFLLKTDPINTLLCRIQSSGPDPDSTHSPKGDICFCCVCFLCHTELKQELLKSFWQSVYLKILKKKKKKSSEGTEVVMKVKGAASICANVFPLEEKKKNYRGNIFLYFNVKPLYVWKTKKEGGMQRRRPLCCGRRKFSRTFLSARVEVCKHKTLEESASKAASCMCVYIITLLQNNMFNHSHTSVYAFIYCAVE